VKIIKLTQGKFTKVDDCDYEAAVSYGSWYSKKKDCGEFYAVSGSSNKSNFMLHLFIASRFLDVAEGMFVDHINHDTLDNTRANLRLCTHSQNMFNRRKLKITTSKYKGVSWYKPRSLWVVKIQANKIPRHVGYFQDEREAAKAYNTAAVKLFGDRACLNVIE